MASLPLQGLGLGGLGGFGDIGAILNHAAATLLAVGQNAKGILQAIEQDAEQKLNSEGPEGQEVLKNILGVLNLGQRFQQLTTELHQHGISVAPQPKTLSAAAASVPVQSKTVGSATGTQAAVARLQVDSIAKRTTQLQTQHANQLVSGKEHLAALFSFGDIAGWAKKGLGVVNTGLNIANQVVPIGEVSSIIA